jgi:hypothetical protein
VPYKVNRSGCAFIIGGLFGLSFISTLFGFAVGGFAIGIILICYLATVIKDNE